VRFRWLTFATLAYQLFQIDIRLTNILDRVAYLYFMTSREEPSTSAIQGIDRVDGNNDQKNDSELLKISRRLPPVLHLRY
jgi:hypothetical protein